MARIGVALSPEQVETLGELLEQLLGAEKRGAGSGQLERERELVETRAQLCDVIARGEGGIDGSGAGNEER